MGRIGVWRAGQDDRPRPYIDPEIRAWLRFEKWRRLVEGNRGIDLGGYLPEQEERRGDRSHA